MINISKLYCGLAGQSDALRYPAQRDHKPIVVFNCTARCNLRCLHCYSVSQDLPQGPEMTTQQAEHFIRQVADYGCPVLLFSGGEPLLREDLFELMHFARSLGLRLVISTNGTLITDDIAKHLAEAGLSYAGISLDGPPLIHDHFRGKSGAFNATLRGIDACRKHGIRTGLRFTMSGCNIEHVAEVFRIATDADVRRICFYHLIRSGRAQMEQLAPAAHSDIRTALDQILDCTASLCRDGRLEEVLTVGNHADGIYLLLRMKEQHDPRVDFVKGLLLRSAGNRIGQNIAAVGWDGQVFADQFWRTHSLGNVNEKSFAHIWDNPDDPIISILRKKDKYKDPRCAKCIWFELCGGNFRSLDGSPDLTRWKNEPECYLTDDEISS